MADDWRPDPGEQAVLDRLGRHAEGKDFRLNPDRDAVRRIVQGLSRQRARHGADYCPCRIPSGDPARDAAIVCPCARHADDIRRDGHCHCFLYVAR